QKRVTGDQLHLHDVTRVPSAAGPGIGKVGRSFHGAAHPARARSRKLLTGHRAWRHQTGAGRLSQNTDCVMKIWRGAKTSVPPGVIERVGENAFETGRGHVGGHFVSNQSNLPE